MIKNIFKKQQNIYKGMILFCFVVFVCFALLSLWYVLGGFNDAWVCVNGKWAEYRFPIMPKPKETCLNGREPFKISELREAFVRGTAIDPASYESETAFLTPLADFNKRTSRRPFGIYVRPGNSLVRGEKFRGYHTGLDIELLPGEEEIEVPVRAICEGELLEKRWSEDYGGLLVQACKLDGKWVQVIYGHLEKSSMTIPIPDIIPAGEQIGILGKGGTAETCFERKHLHLGLLRGTKWDIRQYVNKPADLTKWVDPSSLNFADEKANLQE